MADETNNRFKLTRPASWFAQQHVARREAPPAALQWRDCVRIRLLLCASFFGLWTAAIEARLVYLQVYRHAAFVAQADRQQLRRIKLPAKRGEVLDRNGQYLAYSVDAVTIGVDPSLVEDPPAAASALCRALKLPKCATDREDDLAAALTAKKREGSRFLYVARRISPEAATAVRNLDVGGLVVYNESRRYYPNRELAAQVLGFVGIGNEGLGGIEAAYDNRIRGREGELLVQADLHGRAVETRNQTLPLAGQSVELTLDKRLQYIAEQELRIGVEENHAASGRVVIMQPFTGQILALANYPTFNPNEPGAVDARAKRNRSVEDFYEPGSTFKIVTASAALQEREILPESLVDCSPGYITFGSRRIRDTHHYGVMTFTDVIVKSSNVGAIKVGQKLGAERLTRYVSRFGFGRRLAPDFQGQTPGVVWDAARLDASALASVSMGYQVGITPLQMATAVSAVANGGELLQPRIVRAFIRNGQREEIPRKVLGRSIEPATASVLTQIMEQVVERGTATAAKIPGYTIAGKTGTAALVVNHRYSNSDYYASFVGFVPSRQPEFAIVVVIDAPHGPHGYYGGVVSAPVFQRIAAKALQLAGVPPTLNALPPVLVTARNKGTSAVEATNVSGPIESPMRTLQPGIVPDLRGLSAREALRVLTRVGMTLRQMEGDGFVVEQQPVAGSEIARGNTCILKLDRRPPALPAGGTPQ